MKKFFLILTLLLLTLTIYADEPVKPTFNVTTEEGTLSLKFNVSSNVESIKMIDNDSNIIFEIGKSRGVAGSTIEIPIEDMASGTYFIRVKTESGVQVQRIIISN